MGLSTVRYLFYSFLNIGAKHKFQLDKQSPVIFNRENIIFLTFEVFFGLLLERNAKNLF